MKIIRKKLIFIIFICTVLLSLSGLFIYNYFHVDIDKVLESEEYSYLPDEAKEYVKNAYEATGEIILTEKNKKKNVAYLNPKYINYLQLSSKEKENIAVIPDAYAIDYDFRKLDDGVSLPSSYDLRNHNGRNYVGPMKNQGYTNLCWSFTTGEQIESLILKNTNTEYEEGKSEIFSVRQLDYATSVNGIYNYSNINGYRNLGDGGNFFMSSVALSNAIGLVPENRMPFNELYVPKFLEDVMGYESSSYEVNTAVSIPGFNYESDYSADDFKYYIDIVKSYVYSYGGAYTGTDAPNASCGSLNADGTVILRVDNSCEEDSPHAMHLIGWDDNYNYSYCKEGDYHSSNIASCPSKNIVTGKGAWILKNSWGTTAEENLQYVYLAYDSLNTTFGVTTEIESLRGRTWDNNYHDNFLSDVNGYIMPSDSEIYEKKISGQEKIDKVKFLAYAVSGTYRLNIYDGDKTYYNVKTINVDFPGVYTFDLSDQNIVINEDTFKVEVVGSNSNLISGSISTFTTNIYTEAKAEMNDVNLEKIYTNNPDYTYQITMLSNTKNIESGESVVYKFFKGETDISSDIVVINDSTNDGIAHGKVVSNEVLSIIYLNSELGAGDYTLKMYYNNKEIGSAKVTLNGLVYISGRGSSSDPFIIRNEEQFYMIKDFNQCGNTSCGYYYKLGNDITLTKNWSAVGTSSVPFKGGLDGNGYSINGLKVNGNLSGLFAYASGATIKNLRINKPEIDGTGHSGVIAGYGFNLNISDIGIVGGYVKSTGGSAGSLVGRFEVGNSYPMINKIYNSSTVSGYTSSGLIGTVAVNSAYSGYTCFISISNVLNVGNINFKGFDGDVNKSSILIGEVNESIVDMSNIIVTGRILSNSLINYNGLIGTYSSSNVVNSADIRDVYYVNASKGIPSGNVTGMSKKTISQLIEPDLYSSWTSWDINYVGTYRLPSPSGIYYDFTEINDHLMIGMDKETNLLKYISPDLDAAKNIFVSNIDEEYLTIDNTFNMKGIKTGTTTIHVTSDYDGFDGDIEITIVEKANPAITFNSNDGKNLKEEQVVELNKEFILKENKFTKEGYKFIGWNTMSDGSGDSYNDKQEIDGILEDLTLYAIWEEIKYKVVYNYNGEFENVEVNLKYSDEVNVHVNTYSRENYTFKEWNSKSDGSGKVYSGKISKLTTKDGDVINLYAIWKLNLTFGSDEYDVDESNKVIDMIDANTSIDDFKKKININNGFKVVVETKNNLIYTGGMTKIYDESDKLLVEFVNVIRGDINGDGKISALDYVKVKNHIMKANIIDSKTIYFKAADANNDNNISALDYVRIKNIIMKGAN